MIYKLLGIDIPMPPRDYKKPHRVSTTLELFYDLVIVISIALAASELHHSIMENHIIGGIISYVMVFWTIFGFG